MSCLTERDLILLHYGETPDTVTAETAETHLATCADCRERRDRLTADLARVPMAGDPDPAVGTRLVARINERLAGRQRHWPVFGSAAAGLVALGLVAVVWVPRDQPAPPSIMQPAITTAKPFVGPPRPFIREELLDFDLLEQLDLLEELETLKELEGM